MTDVITKIIQRARRKQSDRSLWSSHWEDVARVTLVRRLGFVSSLIEGDRRTEDLYDSTPIHAGQALSNVVGSMMRPEGQPWAFIKTVEDRDAKTDEAKDWMSDSEERMRRAFNNARARFGQATSEMDLDLVVLGTAPGFMGENIGRGHLIFRSIHLMDALPEYDENGNLHAMFWFRRMPLWQIKDKPDSRPPW